MKTLIIIFLIFGQSLMAQRIVKEEYPVSNSQKVVLEFDFADQISLKSWDKNKVFIKVVVNINDGEDNDNFKLLSSNERYRLFIESKIVDLNKIANKCSTILIENGDTTYINGKQTQLDLNFEVFLPKGTELELETINGDIVAYDLGAPIDLNSINGDIDLYIPEDKKAKLVMETINGTMYTNLDLNILQEKDGLCRIRGNVKSELNGGGPKIRLSTINGIMYLRKEY